MEATLTLLRFKIDFDEVNHGQLKFPRLTTKYTHPRDFDVDPNMLINYKIEFLTTYLKNKVIYHVIVSYYIMLVKKKSLSQSTLPNEIVMDSMSPYPFNR